MADAPREGEAGLKVDASPGTGLPAGGGGDGGELAWVAAEPLFSATTLSDFSNTFQSLIVLSARSVEQRQGEQGQLCEISRKKRNC